MGSSASAQYPESTAVPIDFSTPQAQDACRMREYILEDRIFEHNDDIDYRATNAEGKIHSFTLEALPMSEQVPNPQYDDQDPFSMKKAYARRWWSFDFPGHQRETDLQIVDWPMEVIRNKATGEVVTAGRNDSIRVKMLTLFPRKVLPGIRFVHPEGKASFFEVTLSTGEIARFDALTRKPIGGVVSEVAAQDGGFTPWVAYTPDPPEEDESSELRSALFERSPLLMPAPVPNSDGPVVVRSAPRTLPIPEAPELPFFPVAADSPAPSSPSASPSAGQAALQIRKVYPSTVADYTGAGLVVVSPVTNIDFRDPGNTVTVRTGSPDAACLRAARTTAQKTACSQCALKSDDLWSGFSGDGYSCTQFKFATDAEFDAYLRRKCGFGIPRI